MQSEDTNRPQWSREKSAELVAAFAAAASSGSSLRGFAQAHGVPHSTLQHWLGWLDRTVAPAAVVAFFESPEGLAVLHRFVVAVQFVMGTVCGCGLDAVSKVFELAGLDAFLANSHGSRHKVASEIEQAVCAFARQERERLSQDMQPKLITVCEDETFLPQPCLVAIEPVSDYILVEEYAEGRDADMWNSALAEGLEGLAVEVIQSTSDEGQGLLCHVRKGLGAHHSPDLFHVQQELSRATSVVLASAVRRADDALVKAEAVTQKSRQQAADYGRLPHGRGRPPDFEARIARGRAVEQQ